MIFRYQADNQAKSTTLYKTIRTATGELQALEPLTPSGQQGELVESRPIDALIRGFDCGRNGPH